MRKKTLSLNEVKESITALKGSPVEMSINRGRKKIDSFSAVICDIYPSVFTVTVDKEKQLSTQTFSYFDVMCGDVVINN